MTEAGLAKVERSESYIVGVDDAMSTERLLDQVALIQRVMNGVMRDGEHYGIIPGTGKKCQDCGGKKADCPKCKGTGIVGKPSLLKPGAEKLCFTFRMDPEFDVEILPIQHKVAGHREYRIKCTLFSINSGQRLGSGVGSASTMETKWRFRTGPKELTDKPVPKEYWDIRGDDPKKAQELIGGKGHSTAKGEDGKWYISLQGEKVENENIADVYNTVLKVGKKRALVDAVLTCTAASDCFTQDIEDLIDNGVIVPATSTVVGTTTSAPVSTTPPSAAQAPTVAPPAPASISGEFPTKVQPTAEGEMSEMDMRDTLAMVLSQLADRTNATSKPQDGKVDAGDMLVHYTVNKDGKYGKRKVNDVPFSAAKKAGGTWSPLAAILSRAKKDLEELDQLTEDEIVFG